MLCATDSALLTEIDGVVEELETLYTSARRANPLKAYQPNPAQERFHKSQAQERWFIAGNRTGKTFAGAVEAMRYLMGVHPSRPNKPCSGWVVSVSLDQQREGAEPAILGLIPTGVRPNIRHGAAGSVDTIEFANGSKLAFRTCQQDVQTFQGAQKRFIWFDEEPDQAHWQESTIRVGQDPLDIWTTMTPLQGMTWAYQRLQPANILETIAVITGAIYDNKDHLPASEIIRLEHEFAGDIGRVRLKGEWLDLSGTGALPLELLTRLRDYQREPLRVSHEAGGVLRVFEEPDAEAFYVAGGDPSEGNNDPKSDFQVVQILRRMPLRQAAVWHGKEPADEFGARTMKLGHLYNGAVLGIEGNGLGLASLLACRDYPNLYVEQRHGRAKGDLPLPQPKLGWWTNAQTRPLMQSGIQEAIRDGLEVPDRATVDELAGLIRDNMGRWEGRSGFHDDLALSLMIAVQVHALSPMPTKPVPETYAEGSGSLQERAIAHVARMKAEALERYEGLYE